MNLAVGLTTSNLKSLNHNSLVFSVSGVGFVYSCVKEHNTVAELSEKPGKKLLLKLSGGTIGFRLGLDKVGNQLIVKTGKKVFRISSDSVLLIKPAQGLKALKFSVNSLRRYGAKGRAAPSYSGSLAVWSDAGSKKLRAALLTDIDQYLRGVLQSEIPASYHPEAIKAQAVAARTYSLNPRVNHKDDLVNVCDSYLCCQYFGGLNTKLSKRHSLAIKATSRQVLTFQDKPILALFSSNAGGHTENYENCFSDQKTKRFPPPPIPYLKGVSEEPGKQNRKTCSEKNLRDLYFSKTPKTVDSWSHHFKWQVSVSGNQLEAHLHNNLRKMLTSKEQAPFVVAPRSKQFGHILDITVLKRGVSGTAIELEIKTNRGSWVVKKELVIRDLFVIPKAKIRRLKSARFFLDIQKTSGLISKVSIRGLGWGHGVGMQQTGAQGWAKRGHGYQKILAHYYPGTRIEKV